MVVFLHGHLSFRWCINLSNKMVQLWVIYMSDFGMILNQYFLQRKRYTNGVGESDRWLDGKETC